MRIRRWRKLANHALHLGLSQLSRTALQTGKLLLHRLREGVCPHLAQQNLDSGLVGVVATAIGVIDPQDRFHIKEQIGRRQPAPNPGPDHRGTAKPTPGPDLKTDLA